jgi:hypothetical protein
LALTINMTQILKWAVDIFDDMMNWYDVLIFWYY